MTRIELEDGKYTALYDNGILKALRYGEPWRDMTGDNLFAALVLKVEAMREENDKTASDREFLLTALKDLMIRYETVFNLWAKRHYYEGCNWQSDLDLGLANSRAAIQKVQP